MLKKEFSAIRTGVHPLLLDGIKVDYSALPPAAACVTGAFPEAVR